MLTLPVPLIVSLALAFLLAKIVITGERPWPVLLLLTVCVLQGILISLVQHYGFADLLLLQPVWAAFVPPATYIAFVATTQRQLGAGDLTHLLPPIFMAFCAAFAPQTIDAVLPILFFAYAAAILVQSRKGNDLPLTRLDAGDWPAYIWQAIAISLILSALSDITIAAFMMAGETWARPILVSLGSSLSLLLIGMLSISRMLDGDSEPEEEKASADQALPTMEDEKIVTRLNNLLEQQAVYRDPGMTLAKLARKLGLPAKQLSIAINRVTGESVSRHINKFRIEAACRLLDDGQSVTEAMFESGFNTKSNFNREFRRVTGKTPSEWKERLEAH